MLNSIVLQGFLHIFRTSHNDRYSLVNFCGYEILLGIKDYVYCVKNKYSQNDQVYFFLGLTMIRSLPVEERPPACSIKKLIGAAS